jgi:predicted SpoU family rRNA methylase
VNKKKEEKKYCENYGSKFLKVLSIIDWKKNIYDYKKRKYILCVTPFNRECCIVWDIFKITERTKMFLIGSDKKFNSTFVLYCIRKWK